MFTTNRILILASHGLAYLIQATNKSLTINTQHTTTMKIHKPNKLVKTDSQTESAFIVFSCIIVAGILLIVTVIMENL